MNLDQIKILIDLLEKHPLQEIRYNFSSEESIHLVKEQKVLQSVSKQVPCSKEDFLVSEPRESKQEKIKEPVSNFQSVQSPIVGTFYNSPSPEKPAFVAIGDKVQKDQTLCIIEAMKILNPITAPCSGTVKKIFLENESPVEFNQQLFEIESL
jgi:acetyl-CoA carboxylase biotin carboxyl carrier protein